MDKQGDIEQVRNEMVKLSKVIEQYYETGYIYYNDIQILKKINKESIKIYLVILIFTILLVVSYFYKWSVLWVFMAYLGISTLYLIFKIDRLVSIKNIPETRYEESWSIVAEELKQLRGFKDLDWRINRYRTLYDEVTHVLKQADELGIEEDSKITGILKGFIKLNGKLNS